MSRYARKSEPNVRPVKRIELPEGNLTLRVVLLCLAVVIAITAFGYGINSIFSVKEGWQVIQASNMDTGIAQEFVLQYEIGAGELSATAERKQLSLLYSEALDNAYKLMSDQEYLDAINLYYLNTHPNETLPVNPVLYQTLKTAEKSRILYLGPLFSYYTGLYGSTEDSEAEGMDPYLSDEADAFAQEILEFAGDPYQIRLDILPDNQVCLRISQEYLAYGRENGIDTYLDFGWLRNAFILDAVAQTLSDRGFTRGILASCDGFSRILSPLPGTTNLFSASGGNFRQIGRLSTEGASSIVSFRGFQTSSMEELLYYTYADGTVRTPFVSLQTGRMRNTRDESLTVYSDEYTCGELAVLFYSAFAQEEDVLALAQKHGVFAVSCTETEIKRSDPAITINLS